MKKDSKKIDKNVYILGSGFSNEAKIPLIRDFFQKAREIYESPENKLSDDNYSDFEKVFNFRKRISALRDKIEIDLDNIEKLFSLIDIESSEPILNSIKRLIIRTINEYYSINPLAMEVQNNKVNSFAQALKVNVSVAGNTVTSDLYKIFAALLCGIGSKTKEGKEDVVITFNYDTLIEDALQHIGYFADYGFLENIEDKRRKDTLKKGPFVLKIHGSSNWATRKDSDKIIIFDDSKCVLDDNNHNPYLIPPSWNKSNYGQIRKIWDLARENLSDATRVIIVGYSLPETDLFFQYLLSSGLAENDRLFKIVIVNPALRKKGTISVQPMERSDYEKKIDDFFVKIFLDRKVDKIPTYANQFFRNIRTVQISLNRFDDL